MKPKQQDQTTATTKPNNNNNMDSFDPSDAFACLEPDYVSIAIREEEALRLEMEAMKKIEDEKRRLEEEEVKEKERLKILEDEKLAKWHALNEQSRTEAKIKGDGMMKAIQKQEPNPVKWPEKKPTGISSKTYQEIIKDLYIDEAQQVDPFPVYSDYQDDEHGGIDAFDAFVCGPLASIYQRVLNSKNLDQSIRPICQVSQYHIKECKALEKALSALYEFQPNLYNNMINPFTLRLRSYLEYIKRHEYEMVDVEDAWSKLLHIALVIEPLPTYLSLRTR